MILLTSNSGAHLAEQTMNSDLLFRCTIYPRTLMSLSSLLFGLYGNTITQNDVNLQVEIRPRTLIALFSIACLTCSCSCMQLLRRTYTRIPTSATGCGSCYGPTST